MKKLIMILTLTLLLSGIVYAAPVTPANMQGWGFYEEIPTGSGEMINGPGTVPLGTGSARMVVDGTGRELFGTYHYADTRLDSITALEYSSYRVLGDAALMPSLQLDIDLDVTDLDNTWQGRLVYEPYFTNTIASTQWYHWNTMDDVPNGNWWFSSSATGQAVCPQSNPCTWSEVLAAFPDIGIRTNGALLFKAGGPWSSGFTGNIDNFILNSDVWDFEFYTAWKAVNWNYYLSPEASVDEDDFLHITGGDNYVALHYNTPGTFRSAETPCIEFSFIDHGIDGPRTQMWVEKEGSPNAAWFQIGTWEGNDQYRLYWWNVDTDTEGWIDLGPRSEGEHSFKVGMRTDGTVDFYADDALVQSTTDIEPAYFGDVYLASRFGESVFTDYSTCTDYAPPNLPPLVTIESPSEGDILNGVIDIYGTIVEDVELSHYNIAIYPGDADFSDSSQRLEQETVYRSDGFTDELIYQWDSDLYPEGEYLIRLAARDAAGNRDLSGDPYAGGDDSQHVIKVAVLRDITASPEVAYNPVGTEHTITADIGADIEGIPIIFRVVGESTKESVDTDENGIAVFSYSSLEPGMDTIRVCIDTNRDFSCLDEPTTFVTKYWLEHYVTGGGFIAQDETEEVTRGKKTVLVDKEVARISFSGNVGMDEMANPVGDWNMQFHDVNNDNLDKGHFHSTEITDVEFWYIDGCPDSGNPESLYNRVNFFAVGRFNQEDGWTMEFRGTDFGEPGVGRDGVRILLWNPDGTLVYDSHNGATPAADFPDEVDCSGVRTKLDGGNIQIHPPQLVPELLPAEEMSE